MLGTPPNEETRVGVDVGYVDIEKRSEVKAKLAETANC